MIIHHVKENPTTPYFRTTCGTKQGAGINILPIAYTTNKESVTCKRCLAKIETK